MNQKLKISFVASILLSLYVVSMNVSATDNSTSNAKKMGTHKNQNSQINAAGPAKKEKPKFKQEKTNSPHISAPAGNLSYEHTYSAIRK